MSTATRMERIEAAIQEPMYDGSYRPAEVKKFAWMCDGCRLVWPMRHQARDCESRGHRSTYVQEYWTNGFDPTTGKPRPPTLHPREALRREPAYIPEELPKHLATAQARERRRDFHRDYSVRVGAYLFHIVADPEAEARESLAACGAHDDWRINATSRIFRATMRGQTIWNYTADGLPHSVFVTHEQAIALDLPPKP